MKLCPTCQRTYPDDAPDYCSNDGMRLLDEEAAGYDPEKTMLSSGLRTSEPEPSATPLSSSQPAPPPAQQYFAPEEMPGNQPPQWQPPPNQPVPPPPPPVAQGAPQAWSPTPPQPAQPWPTPYQGHGASAPYAPPLAGGKSRALAIAALVTGACAVTIMSLLVARSGDFMFGSLLVLSILGLGLGVAALILSLQKPARFGGVPLAIAGLALGTAGLVYYFTL